jgi:DNA-directed RNA polymerase I subunit RPA49
MLAVHRKSTGATMLVPVQAHTIMPTIKARRRAEDQERSTLTAEEQRILLGQTFGTKKAQKRIAAQQRNKIDAEAADLVELQPHLLANIEAATATLPTLKRIKEEADAARPVPSFDTAATDPRHIYSVEDVAPQGETKAVPIYGLLQAGSAEERIQMLPYKRSRFVNDRLARLLDDLGEAPPSGKQKKQIRYLYLLSAHMAFRSRTHSKDGPRGRLDGIGVPPAIITGIGDRFSEKSKQGKACVLFVSLRCGYVSRRCTGR